MMTMEREIEGNLAYGPVPSRRLGRSLGINNIPPKHCSYSCVYCQVGKSSCNTITRQCFYSPAKIFEAVQERVDVVRSNKERIDYLAFVPDGEPTLDENLGVEIELLKNLGIPIAVITNSSMLSRPGVLEALHGANLVSLKFDACSEMTWRLINRPCKGLSLKAIQDGIKRFSADFKGVIITETMILDSMDYHGEIEAIASFIGGIAGVEKAFISTPTRPPAEPWVKPASPGALQDASDAFNAVLGKNRVEIMDQYEGNDFSCTGKAEESLLEIVAVHPMREEAAVYFLARGGKGPERLDALVAEGKLERKTYIGHVYFVKKHETAKSS